MFINWTQIYGCKASEHFRSNIDLNYFTCSLLKVHSNSLCLFTAFYHHTTLIQGDAWNGPEFDLLMKSLFPLQYYKLTHKRKDHFKAIYPLLIKCSVWPPLRLATSSTWAVMLFITEWHISSIISLQASVLSGLSSIIVCGFFRKIYTLRNSPKKWSHGFKWGPFGGQFCVHAKRSGNWFEMRHELKVLSRKSKTTFVVCSLVPPCMYHWVCNGKPVARRWGTKVLRIVLK